jgi:hypothetical protein
MSTRQPMRDLLAYLTVLAGPEPAGCYSTCGSEPRTDAAAVHRRRPPDRPRRPPRSWRSAARATSTSAVSRAVEVGGGRVCAVVESMTGAGLVHDTLEQEGWSVEIRSGTIGVAPVDTPASIGERWRTARRGSAGLCRRPLQRARRRHQRALPRPSPTADVGVQSRAKRLMTASWAIQGPTWTFGGSGPSPLARPPLRS